jgi:DNA-binding IclR family transcriptional regulator
MRFWDKSLRNFNSLCDNATQSVRHLAQQTGLAKSSVHRLRQAMERRHGHPESWLWETEDGQRMDTRLRELALGDDAVRVAVNLGFYPYSAT